MRTTPAASITKTIFTSESLQDPYPVYANLCAEGPIHHVQFNGPRWALVRHLECSTLLRDPRLAASGRIRPVLLQLPADMRTEFAALERMLGMWMLLLDAPQHTRLRKLMNKGFAPRVVASLRDQVAAIVDAFPRLEMKQRFTHAVCCIIETRAATTYDNFARDFGERFVPAYKPTSTVDYLLNSPFKD